MNLEPPEGGTAVSPEPEPPAPGAARPHPAEASGAPATDPAQVRTTDLRRLHPLTPIFHSWRLVGLAAALGFGVFRDNVDQLRWVWDALHGNADLGLLAKAFLIFAAAALGSVVLGWLSWRTTGFAIVGQPGEAGTLLYHHGLINRQRSQVRLKRVQSVDVNQPFVPRLAGLAAVQLDMAAGEGATVNLSYLSLSDAWALREEILRHTSVVPGAPSAGHPDSRDAGTGAWTGTTRPSRGAAPDRVIGQVDTAYLVKATLLDGSWAWMLLLTWIVAVIVIGLVAGWAALAAAFTGILPVTIALLVQLREQAQTILRDADFTVMRTPTGIRTRAGLTSTTNRTIELDRLQSIRVERPLPWRWFGWARVNVDVAGATKKSSGASLMPVAADAVAVALAGGVAGEPIEPQAGGFGGADPVAGRLVGAGARVRLVDPFTWRWLGVALLDRGAVTRTGWWTRQVSYVPYARVQSVSVRQGWLQRRLGLATVFLDLPSGASRWTAPHRDVAEAAQLVRRLSEAARVHRRAVANAVAAGGTAAGGTAAGGPAAENEGDPDG